MDSKEADEFISVHSHNSILFSISLCDPVARNGAVGSRIQQYRLSDIVFSPIAPLALTELSSQDLAFVYLSLVFTLVH